MNELSSDNVYRIEPLRIDNPPRELVDKGTQLLVESAKLSGFFFPTVQTEIQSLVRSMNGYYSNLIEGHRTRPEDIERALNNDFSSQPKQKDLQILHLAHIKTQTAIEEVIEKDPSTPICTPDFLKWIHRTLYQDLPESLRFQENAKGERFEVRPGEFRDHEVAVGTHIGPPANSLENFFKRFGTYESSVSSRPESLISAMASHHRLAWLHPFPDGNGRVARLFTHAWLLKAGVPGLKMWTLSRGLARSRDEYYSSLVGADSARQGDFDGRGARSLKKLVGFCDYMVTTGVDQVQFMHSLLEPEKFINRAGSYCRFQEQEKNLPVGAAVAYQHALAHGKITRSEITALSEKSRRSAQQITATLLHQGYLKSPSWKGDLFPAFPPSACSFLFPELYPGGGESTQRSPIGGGGFGGS